METKKGDKCELCGKLGGMGKTQDTSNGHILCYDCAKEAEDKGLISVDTDGILYDYTDDRLGSYIREKTEAKEIVVKLKIYCGSKEEAKQVKEEVKKIRQCAELDEFLWEVEEVD